MTDMTETYGILCEGTGLALESAVTEAAANSEGVDSILLIGGIWGESGFYEPSVLERDVTKFQKGVHMFEGHPTEGTEEPAGKTIGVLGGAARYVASDPEADGKPTIRGPIRIFNDRKEWVKERAEAGVLGLSHRSAVRYAMGTREGKYGRVLTGIDNVLSVDVVARAGAGGRIGVFKESAQPGSVANKEMEGSEMPLSKEELAEIGGVFAEALKPQLEGITSALGELKTIATESAKPQALTFSEVSEKITAAKLPAGAVKRLNDTVSGSKEGVTATFLESEIAKEQTIWEESSKAALAAIADGTLTVTDGGGDKSALATESKGVKAWTIQEGK